MPYRLAKKFADAWNAGRFRVGVTGEPNDEDDWIMFDCKTTDVYVRFFNNKLTLATPMAMYFLHIDVGAIRDVVRLLYEMEITLQTIEYKYGEDVFFQDTYQLRAPTTELKLNWEPTKIPEVPRDAFKYNFMLNNVEDRYPPAIYPEIYAEA